MNLGFRKQGMTDELRRNCALLAAICALLVPHAVAHAQDMSFDLDEAESAPADSGDAGGDAEGDAGGDAEGGAEASAGGEVGGDIFSQLSADGGADIAGEAETGPKEKEVVEEIYAVQRMYVLRNGRLELAPSIGFAVNDPYTARTALSGALNYWITNVLAVGGNVLWYQGLDSESQLNFTIRKSARLAVPITEYQLAGHLNFTYVPIYGKFNMFNQSIFQWDSYLVGGVGLIRTRPIAVIDPAVRKYNFDWRLSFNVGMGIRVFISKWLSIFGELRDYIYLEKLENLDVALGQARQDKATWIDENSSLTNNFMVQVGISMFFPFTFEYRYPK